MLALGEIPPEVGNLTDLLVLNLSNNDFTGEIPPELGNFGRLSELVIRGARSGGDSRLTGEIPGDLANSDSGDLPFCRTSKGPGAGAGLTLSP